MLHASTLGNGREPRRNGRLPALFSLLATLASLALAPACTSRQPEHAAPPAGPSAVRGKQVYQTVCIACHNSDPTKPGSLGPDLAGSSRELIEARVMRAAYPPGYRPKRPTHIMQPLTQVQGDIESISLYLNSKP